MDTPEQVKSFTVEHFRLSQLSCSQTARNRELTEAVFPNGTALRYGSAILRPEYCGKWIVSLGTLHFVLYIYTSPFP